MRQTDSNAVSWKFVQPGIDREIEIDGHVVSTVNRDSWRETNFPRVELTDPLYPRQRETFWVYAVATENGRKSVVFGHCEVTPGVDLFIVPVA